MENKNILDYIDDIGVYAVHSSEYEGAPSPILQVFDQYKEDLIWGQDAAHYVGAMSDDGRQVVHVQAGFRSNSIQQMVPDSMLGF